MAAQNDARSVSTDDSANRKLKPQKDINDQEFAEALKGYKKLEDYTELFNLPMGGRVRYVIDVFDERGSYRERRYRYGGILTVVDPSLRYIMLKNPTIKPGNNSRGARPTWSVQLKDPLQQTTLYYMPSQSEEVTKYRQLLSDIASGKVTINKNSE